MIKIEENGETMWLATNREAKIHPGFFAVGLYWVRVGDGTKGAITSFLGLKDFDYALPKEWVDAEEKSRKISRELLNLWYVWDTSMVFGKPLNINTMLRERIDEIVDEMVEKMIEEA